MEGGTSQISTTKVIAAFAVIYVVWGSTYFFILLAIQHMPVTVMGALRFLTAGLLMLGWCLANGEKLWKWKNILSAFFIGLLLLFVGNGAVAWSEQFLPSSVVAVFLASAPIWFVLLDYSKWKANFSSPSIIAGLATGFIGIILLFKEKMGLIFSGNGNKWEMISIGALVIGSVAWVSGSLYSKYKPTSFSGTLNSGWQMMGAGLAYVIVGGLRGDWSNFNWGKVPGSAWLAVVYLVTMGSLVGYSSYVWLLKVRPATQVSTHAYVNPVVAVLLGVFFANEKISPLQITGLAVILAGVLLVNLARYRSKY